MPGCGCADSFVGKEIGAEHPRADRRAPPSPRRVTCGAAGRHRPVGGLDQPRAVRMRRSGLVAEEAAAVSGVGRPPSVVRFRPEAAHVVGIDAGGASLRVEIVDLAGRFIARSSVTLRGAREPRRDRRAGSPTGRAPWPRASGLVRSPPRRASPASSTPRGGTVLLSPGPARAQRRGRRRPCCAERLDMPVAIDNDDLLAAAGEAAFGAAEGLHRGRLPVAGARARAPGCSSAGGRCAACAPPPARSPTSRRAPCRTCVGPGDPAPLQQAPRRARRHAARTAKRVIELAAAGDADARAVLERCDRCARRARGQRRRAARSRGDRARRRARPRHPGARRRDRRAPRASVAVPAARRARLRSARTPSRAAPAASRSRSASDSWQGSPPSRSARRTGVRLEQEGSDGLRRFQVRDRLQGRRAGHRRRRQQRGARPRRRLDPVAAGRRTR